MQPLKALVQMFSGRVGTTLGWQGNFIPLKIMSTAPTSAPPGGKGVVMTVSAGVVTFYVWDGTAWRAK